MGGRMTNERGYVRSASKGGRLKGHRSKLSGMNPIRGYLCVASALTVGALILAPSRDVQGQDSGEQSVTKIKRCGHHSVSAPLNIGVADVNSPLDVSFLPVFTLVNNTTGNTVQTTDPGRALITGKWADIGKLKGPILRGIASRAPYFHNGSAATLADVIFFYEKRFQIRFTSQEKADLIAFLNSL